MPITNETSLQTYQNFDGSNTTMLMQSFNTQLKDNITLSGGIGGSTNFQGKNSFVFEGKAKYNLNEHFNLQTRLRNSFSPKGNSSQLRLAAGYKTSLNNNLSIYVTPYVTAKYSYPEKKLSHDIGAFSGLTYKITPKNSVSCEIQKYNGFNGGAENVGLNVILNHNF